MIRFIKITVNLVSSFSHFLYCSKMNDFEYLVFFYLHLHSRIVVWEGVRRVRSAINPVVYISASER